jgi:CheY-like chemotaxis protein
VSEESGTILLVEDNPNDEALILRALSKAGIADRVEVAAQAIEEGSVQQNEIRVRTWARGDEVMAEIADTGVGISRENLDHLFDPFFTTKQVGVGSGLGLSICHNIITTMGGAISVESKPGEGTRFTVMLPVSRAPVVEKAAEDEERAAAPGARGRFLIVDDEAHIGEAMERMLSDEHDTVFVESGARAMKLLEQDQTFDGVICDLMMPDVTGMDLHNWLADRNRELANRMIFITGGAFTPRAKAFLNQVENPRLEKPFDPRNLKAWLRSLL